MSNQNDFQGTQENLDLIIAKLDALHADSVRRFNLPVPTTVAIAMTLWKSYKQDEALFVSAFKSEAFNPADFEDFPARAGGLWQADVLLEQVINPKSENDKVLEHAKPLHAKMGKAARYLWEDDEDRGSIVAAIRSGHGNMDIADDLVRYSALFAENWVFAEQRCDVTQEDIKMAKEFGTRILDVLTKVPASDTGQLRDQRNRAGEYLRQGVDHIRAAAAFIFRNDPEAAERYPSLYAGRRAPKKRTPATKITNPETTST